MTVGNKMRITKSMTIIENSFFPAFWPQFIVKITCYVVTPYIDMQMYW